MTPPPTLPTSTDPLAARRAALAVLNDWDQTQKTLDAVLSDMDPADRLGSKRERDFFNALVYGVMRWRLQIDYYIGQFSSTPLRKIDPFVLNVMRLALMQMIHMDRIPDSAAVNTSVELAKATASPWVVRFVNAVLRNAARNHRLVHFPASDHQPIEALAVRHALPEWLIRRWLKRFGADETDLYCSALNGIAPIVLRTNTLVTSSAHLFGQLTPKVGLAAYGRYAPDCIHIQRPTVPVSELPGYQNGWFQVQDEAAQLVTLLLNPKAGEHVMDACAGIGGKTGHMAQLMANTGKITALEKVPAKLETLKAQMNRLGINIVVGRCHDLSRGPDAQFDGHFDRILLDAPCSGLGVIRRNPDTKWRVKTDDLSRYQKLQRLFLDNVSSLVKTSGILVYAVCSTEPEETHDVVDSFLQNHPEFRLSTTSHSRFLPDGAPIDGGMLRTFSHLHGMDGFFAARLRRIR